MAYARKKKPVKKRQAGGTVQKGPDEGPPPGPKLGITPPPPTGSRGKIIKPFERKAKPRPGEYPKDHPKAGQRIAIPRADTLSQRDKLWIRRRAKMSSAEIKKKYGDTAYSQAKLAMEKRAGLIAKAGTKMKRAGRTRRHKLEKEMT